MPGTRLSSKMIVGSLTLVTRETVIRNVNGILLGIPACEMPFTMSNSISLVNDLSSSNSFSIHTLLLTCIWVSSYQQIFSHYIIFVSYQFLLHYLFT